MVNPADSVAIIKSDERQQTEKADLTLHKSDIVRPMKQDKVKF